MAQSTKRGAYLPTNMSHAWNSNPCSIRLDKRKGIIRVTASLDKGTSHRDDSRRHSGGREEDAQRLEKGMKVDALYRGGKRSYPGTIMIVNRDGTCDVDYDDGEKETRVKPGLITPVRSPHGSPRRTRLGGDDQSDRRVGNEGNIYLVEGTRVEARYKGRGRFYPGVITQVLRDGSCNIAYDDGEKERMVSPSLIKIPDESFTRTTGADKERGQDHRGAPGRLETGTRVEARYMGRSRYFPGVVARVHRDGSCDIDYDDGGKETMVQPALIKQSSSGSTRTDGESGNNAGRSRKSGSSKGQVLEKGMRIEARYKGRSRYYPGKLMMVRRDGSCDIDYDDGEREQMVEPSLIKVMEPHRSTSPGREDASAGNAELREGGRVEARYKGRGRYYPGVISRIRRDGSCDIDYDDGEKEQMVDPSLVKTVGKARGEGEGVAGGDGVREGARVEARYRGRSRYYPGRISRVHRDGACDIDYDDGEKERMVEPSLLRVLRSSSPSRSPTRGHTSPTRARSSGVTGEVVSDKEGFREGMKVEARYKGRSRYYPGTVARVYQDGSCDVDYDDGEKERMVEASLIKRYGGERAQPSSGDSTDLREGVRVEARYKGRNRYYPGRISRVRRDGSCDIDYDDGEKEHMVEPSMIKVLGREKDDGRSPTGNALREGVKVEARYKGRDRYYPGRISRVHRDGSCDIDYDDGEKEYMVEPSLIKVLGREKSDGPSPTGDSLREGMKVEARYKGGRRLYPGRISRVHRDGSCDIDYDDGEKERMVEPSLIKVLGREKGSGQWSTSDSLREGMKVEARYKGRVRYYPGRISQVHRDGSCNIDYDDGEKERMVEPSLIKVLGRDNDRGQSPTGDHLREGVKVEARYKGRGRYYPGKVSQVHRDGSCDIDYDDGEKERMVEPSLIKVLGREKDDGPSSTGDSLREGVKVEARYKGRSRYYPGRISQVHRDGSCNIDYDDGEKERMVEPSLIKVLDRGKSERPFPREDALREGMKVEARYKGRSRYYPGRISRVHRDGACDIDYDDGEKERMMEPSLIKVFNKGKGERPFRGEDALQEGMKVEARYKGRSRYYPGRISRVHRDGACDIDYDDGEKERMVDASLVIVVSTTRDGGASLTAGTLREGTKVEARFKGRNRYYPGRISRVHRDGSCDIDYDDGEEERMVEPSLIRATAIGEHGGEGAAADSLREGTKVEARYKGRSRYYPGRVSRVHRDGSCDIDYDDGEKERMVDQSLVKSLEARSRSPTKSDRSDILGRTDTVGNSDIAEGSKVEARFRGRSRYYPGKVLNVHRDGSFDIRYDDGESERMVDPSLVKLLGSRDLSNPRRGSWSGQLRQGQRVEARYKGRNRFYPGVISRIHGDGTYDVDYDDGEQERMVESSLIKTPPPHHRSPSGAPSSSDDELRKGYRVEARYKGRSRYYPGTVTRVRADGSVDIDYDDGEQERAVERSLVTPLEPPQRKGRRQSFGSNDVGRRQSDSRGSQGSDSDELEVGMKIEADFRGRGRYYPGRITYIHRDGLCDIDYEDGENERMVNPSLVRRKPDSRSTRAITPRRADSDKNVFEEGDKIEANYRRRGKYHAGSIVRVRPDGTVDVRYDDGDKEIRVSTGLVRPVAAHPRHKASRNMNGGGSTRRSSDEERDASGRAARRSRSRGRYSEEDSGQSTRGRSRSVSRGGLGKTRLLGNKHGSEFPSSSGDDGSEGSLDGDRKNRGRRHSGSRRPSSGGDTTRKQRGEGAGRRRTRGRSSRVGGDRTSDSEEVKEFSQGSHVEACWHRASPYSRPRRTSNWVSALVPQKLPVGVIREYCCP